MPWRPSKRTSAESYAFWTRASLYALLAAVPLLVLGLTSGQQQVRQPGLAVFLLLAAAQAGICIPLLHASLRYYLASGPGPTRSLLAAGIGLTVAAPLAAAWALPAVSRDVPGAIPAFAWVVILSAGALATALAPRLSLPALFGLILVSAAAAGAWPAVGAAGGSSGPAFVGGVICLIGVGSVALTCRVSVWTLRIMAELGRSRAAHARLSVAEERLRFARDLHDVLGRNLSLMAVKSELAAQLARRGDDEEAAGHMLQVRAVAHESQREMRAVVSGYRAADLGSELAGAQAVLRSAGASCRIIGDATKLPQQVQAALGWVVREGITNIIRHSDATACTIELDVVDPPGAPSTVTLRMENDRARSAAPGTGGTGLLGLGERLADLGGSISTGHPGTGRFRLEATLPASVTP
jgi:two-component system, NarL family, sensor histidine kinase DesK